MKTTKSIQITSVAKTNGQISIILVGGSSSHKTHGREKEVAMFSCCLVLTCIGILLSSSHRDDYLFFSNKRHNDEMELSVGSKSVKKPR